MAESKDEIRSSRVGIDLSPHMLVQARKRKASLSITTELHQMDVKATDFPAGHFDYVIATFLFCVLDDEDQLPALRELRRVCKPDGEIRLLEYTYSRDPMRRFVMRLWAPWVRFMYGATFDRHTDRYVQAAGLRLVEERFLLRTLSSYSFYGPNRTATALGNLASPVMLNRCVLIAPLARWLGNAR